MGPQWWQKHVYTDEVYLSCGSQRHIRTYARRPPHTAHQLHYLAPTFIHNVRTIGFWGAFTSKGHSKPVPLPVRAITKRDGKAATTTIPNSKTYINHILLPHIVPLYEELGGSSEGCRTIEDGATYHTSAETSRWRKMFGVVRLDWSAPHLILTLLRMYGLYRSDALGEFVRNLIDVLVLGNREFLLLRKFGRGYRGVRFIPGLIEYREG